MTQAEYDRLADLEANISDHWWEMGLAYAEIRDKKLYRRTPDGQPQTWEEYCRKKHKQSKQYIDRLIRASVSVGRMRAETKVSVVPATPSQAHELVGLDPEEMATATSKAGAAGVAGRAVGDAPQDIVPHRHRAAPVTGRPCHDQNPNPVARIGLQRIVLQLPIAPRARPLRIGPVAAWLDRVQAQVPLQPSVARPATSAPVPRARQGLLNR